MKIPSYEKIMRPWGYYQVLYTDNNIQIKFLQVEPGQKLSLQRHKRRSEIWVINEGLARVTINDKIYETVDEKCFVISAGDSHRLENIGQLSVKITEIQRGLYFGEDDIERLEDMYGRI